MSRPPLTSLWRTRALCEDNTVAPSLATPSNQESTGILILQMNQRRDELEAAKAAAKRSELSRPTTPHPHCDELLWLDTKDEAAAALVADALQDDANEPEQLARRGGLLALKAICTEFQQDLFQALPSLKSDVDVALVQLTAAVPLSNDQVQGIINALTALESTAMRFDAARQWLP